MLPQHKLHYSFRYITILRPRKRWCTVLSLLKAWWGSHCHFLLKMLSLRIEFLLSKGIKIFILIGNWLSKFLYDDYWDRSKGFVRKHILLWTAFLIPQPFQFYLLLLLASRTTLIFVHDIPDVDLGMCLVLPFKFSSQESASLLPPRIKGLPCRYKSSTFGKSTQ